MRGSLLLAVLVASGAILAPGLAAFWAVGTGSSEAQQGVLHSCPQAGKWAIAVWDGDDGSDADQALGTCGQGAVAVAYSIDPNTQVWSRWFAGRPDISNLTALDNMQGVMVLGGAGAAATGSSGSSAQQEAMQNCPLPGKWAIAVWDGDDGSDADQALGTCGQGAVAVAYSIDPDTQLWSHWFAGRPDISNLTALDNMRGVMVLGGAEAPTPTPTPTAIGTVDVLGIWDYAELIAFNAMVAPWEADTGGDMAFTGTRDITTVLTIRVEGGNPPDVAIPAEVGRFQQFAREGRLTPLSACEGLEETVRANYPQGFIDLGTVDGTLYGFFMKADTKATIWYDPQFFADNGYEPLTADSTFDDLIALSDQILADGTPPWSIGVESAAASGWPGTDWIQQILLNEAGGAVYDGVIDGSIPFTDSRVKDAWEKFGQIALTEGYTVQEGAVGINATNFIDSTYPPFETPPTAAMVHLGGFASGLITAQFPDAVAGEDFDFFPFPGGGVTGGANIVYAFNDDETTCSFLNHLASAEAQQVWVDLGGFTSVNSQVSLDAYPDAVARAQAEQLAGAAVFRFDLDDAIGGALQLAFFDGVTQYLANPDDLDDILANIEASRE